VPRWAWGAGAAGAGLGALALVAGAGLGAREGLWELRDLAGRAPARAAFAPIACAAGLAIAAGRARGIPAALALELHGLDLALQGGPGRLQEKFAWGSRRKDMLQAFTLLALLQATGAAAALCVLVAAWGGTRRGAFDVAGLAFAVGSALYHVGIAGLRWWGSRLDATVQTSDIYAVAEEGGEGGEESEDEGSGRGGGAGAGAGGARARRRAPGWGGVSPFKAVYGALAGLYLGLAVAMLAVNFAAGGERGGRWPRLRPGAQWVCVAAGLVWEAAFAADLRRHSLAQGPPEVTVQPRTLF